MAVRARYVIEGPGGEKCVPMPAKTEKPRAANQR